MITSASLCYFAASSSKEMPPAQGAGHDGRMSNSQRQFPRYEIRLSVEIEPAAGSVFEPQTYHSINISLGGLLISGERKKHNFLAEPTVKVTVDLPLPYGRVRFLGSPIRMSIDGSIGLSIVQIGKDDEERYQGFVKTFVPKA